MRNIGLLAAMLGYVDTGLNGFNCGMGEIPFNLRNSNNQEALDSANRKIAFAQNKYEFEKA